MQFFSLLCPDCCCFCVLVSNKSISCKKTRVVHLPSNKVNQVKYKNGRSDVLTLVRKTRGENRENENTKLIFEQKLKIGFPPNFWIVWFLSVREPQLGNLRNHRAPLDSSSPSLNLFSSAPSVFSSFNCFSSISSSFFYFLAFS